MTATVEDVKQEAPESKPVDLDAILPVGGRIVVDGVEVEVRRLKTREFLLLMRVITNGLGGSVASLRIDMSNPETLQSDMTAILMLAIPNAIEEFGMFLLSICKPVVDSDRVKMANALDNPDPEVLIDILGVLVEQEKDDLVMLAGKVRAWLARIQPTLPKTATG